MKTNNIPDDIEFPRLYRDLSEDKNNELSKRYPKVSFLNFSKTASLNWQNLLKEKESCIATWLYEVSKPKKGRVEKRTIFTIWLYLCIEQPWETQWRPLIVRENVFFGKIEKLLEETNGKFPDNMLPRTLRAHIKKNNFREKVIRAAYYHFMYEKAYNRISYQKLREKIKFARIITTEKHIKKRDLQRKLRIKKNKLESHLQWAERIGEINRIPCPYNSEWIVLKQ